MRRRLWLQQQCYADDGTWIGSQAQQQSYAVHEESWSSDNHYDKQFPGMDVKLGAFAVESELSESKQRGKLLGGSHGLFQESRHGVQSHDIFEEESLFHRNGHVSGGAKKFPFNGAVKLTSSGGHHGYFSREAEYEAYSDEPHGQATMKADEVRFGRHNWGGDGFCANPCDMTGTRTRNLLVATSSSGKLGGSNIYVQQGTRTFVL